MHSLNKEENEKMPRQKGTNQIGWPHQKQGSIWLKISKLNWHNQMKPTNTFLQNLQFESLAWSLYFKNHVNTSHILLPKAKCYQDIQLPKRQAQQIFHHFTNHIAITLVIPKGKTKNLGWPWPVRNPWSHPHRISTQGNWYLFFIVNLFRPIKTTWECMVLSFFSAK